MGQRAGASLGLTYAAAIDGDVDCEYESEDSDLMVKSHCQDYESLVRQGVRICQALWATDDSRDAGQDAGLHELLDYVMVTTLPAA